MLTELNLPASDFLDQRIAAYSHIELSREEILDGLLYAYVRADHRLEQQALKEREDRNRQFLFGREWDYEHMKFFALRRAAKLFGGKFTDRGQGSLLFQLLCCYFTHDEGFFTLADQMKIENPSFDKGMMIFGNVGVGKSWMMKLFSRNQRQCYEVVPAKKITRTFLEKEKGAENLEKYRLPFAYLNDIETFNQAYGGLCIDDMGTEELSNSFGNKLNVIEDVILSRYDAGFCGSLLHATCNMDRQGMKSFYGDRVLSRLREVMNSVFLDGQDLRK